MEIYSEAVKKSPTVARWFPGAAGQGVEGAKIGECSGLHNLILTLPQRR